MMTFESNDNLGRSRKEKVSPYSHERADFLQLANENIDRESSDACFGSYALETLESLERDRDALKDPGHELHALVKTRATSFSRLGRDFLENIDVRKERTFRQSLREFIEYFDKHTSRVSALRLVENCFQDDKLKKQLDQLLKRMSPEIKDINANDPLDYDPLERLMLTLKVPGSQKLRTARKRAKIMVELIRTERISPETWVDMLKVHREQYMDSKRIIFEYLPEYEQRLTSRISAAISNSELPIEDKSLRGLFNSITFEVSDGMRASFEQVAGQYIGTTEKIYLSSDVITTVPEDRGKEALYRIFVHEIFHALSGKTMLIERDEIPDDNGKLDTYARFQTQRVGLRFMNRFNRSNWLNEAITERLTKKYTETRETNRAQKIDIYSYKKERELFEFLLKRYDLDERLFLEAYFEDYEPENRKRPEGAIPKWKRLYKHLNEKCGSGVFLQMSKDIEKRGIDVVLKELKEQNPDLLEDS